MMRVFTCRSQTHTKYQMPGLQYQHLFEYRFECKKYMQVQTQSNREASSITLAINLFHSFQLP